MLKHIESVEQFEELLKNKKVVLDFYADWCGPCRMLSPIIEELAEQYGEEVAIAKLNVDNVDEIPEKFKYIHFHAYTINYNDKGEIKHLMHGENMPDGSEGLPNLNYFVELLKEMGISPWVISEASDTQEIGAQYMRDLYNK